MTYENYIKARLVNYVIREGYHYGGLTPMLAIAQVLANRVKAGWRGGDWLEVIFHADEVRGTVHDNGEEVPISSRDLNFRYLLQRIDEIYYGTVADSPINVETENGIAQPLYYAELHNINREWFKTNILNDLANHPRIATVGELTFFG
jgi:hypothetical protein